ncbi:DUF29 domain-containing protein [Endozoicomonas sp. ALC020]|uniref:DUF29 domain-containing protein n=1 Tax=Endozoicomonas sp. ALC020 TaxID=3403077 RepID=UPI003BB15022
MDNLYETDFYQWVQKQKQLLINRQFDQLDLENLIEEVGDMGKSEPRSIESHLTTLLLHLLKYEYQTYQLEDRWIAEMVVHTWYPSMDNPRREIRKLLKQSPSLQPKTSQLMHAAYAEARIDAIKQMNRYIKQKSRKLNASSFPDDCPWTFEQIMGDDWLP